MNGPVARQMKEAYLAEEESLHELQLRELEGTECGLDALHTYEQFVVSVTEDDGNQGSIDE
ncbi:hypothetical protein G4V62_11765 [Bacillaceae bacterium SIJ1]|uniref:hypothetical protein n=1 Tax=Litoribacterium kuwaitense TaxID=1398745 RepID=UPI0013EA3B62|nr:hypothetical protein [Litoribacterium kuwaitense]NGP45597.1 hypothetical protein [Litoribacterium kuwaitense]